MWVILVRSALAACPAGSAGVAADIDRAESAFGALDLPGFEAARETLHADLGCVSERLSAPVVARVHGVDALAAIVKKDDASATASIQAARATDPSYTLPAVVPEGHRLRELFAQITTVLGPTEPIAVPEGTRAFVDGTAGASRPTDRPSVVLLEDEAGKVLWSDHLAVGEPVPDLARFAVAPAPPPVTKTRRKVNPALAVSGAVVAVGSGVLFGLASAGASQFADEDTAYEDLAGLRSRTNAFTLLGSAGVGVALGLGTATVLTVQEVE